MALEPIVFFGTGPVAAASLKLLAKKFEIEAIITKPRPPHHKGQTPVLDAAAELDIPTFTASNKQELDTLFKTKPVSSRLAVLIDFGIIVSKQIIDYFPLGIINSHFSVLPDLKGADPITFAILSGQDKTGVSLMMLVEAMDEGPLIGYGEFDLPSDITEPELTQELIFLSDALLTHELPHVLSGKARGAPQSITKRTPSLSRRLTKDDGKLDWSKPAAQLEREIRAFISWPTSRTLLGSKEVTITKAHVIEGSGKLGTLNFDKNELSIQTSDGRLAIDMLKPAGKTEMTIAAFLAGYQKQLQTN